MDTMNEIEKVPQVVQSTVYNALSGTKSMKVETLFYICEALGISPKDFVEYFLSMGTRTEIADRLSRHRDLVKVWGRWDPEWDDRVCW